MSRSSLNKVTVESSTKPTTKNRSELGWVIAHLITVDMLLKYKIIYWKCWLWGISSAGTSTCPASRGSPVRSRYPPPVHLDYSHLTVIMDLSVNLPEYRRGLSGKRYIKTQSKLTFYADLAELEDALDLGSSTLCVWVRPPESVPWSYFQADTRM